MDQKTQIEVLQSYKDRDKGIDNAPFVDATRNGSYLQIDPVNGTVQELTEWEYRNSRLPQLRDGVVSTNDQTSYGNSGFIPRENSIDDIDEEMRGFDYTEETNGLTPGPDDD